jgi:hypothetical protein
LDKQCEYANAKQTRAMAKESEKGVIECLLDSDAGNDGTSAVNYPLKKAFERTVRMLQVS